MSRYNTQVSVIPPPLRGLSHIQLYVSDIDTSVEWYRKALFLEETGRADGRYVGLESASGHFRFALFPDASRAHSGSIDHLAFAVPGFEALTGWVTYLDECGIPHGAVKPNPRGHSVDLFDPDGNNIELVSEE
jgi:catechol 2,3-dioxygenase-like lactoylglutathione lyase family enzyme